ncbi:MAG: hypothetical protein V4649_14570 [Bacteroidota bacterium]
MAGNKCYIFGLLLLGLFSSCRKEVSAPTTTGPDTTGIGSTHYVDTTLRNTRKMGGMHHWVGATYYYDWGAPDFKTDTPYETVFDRPITVINDSVIFFDHSLDEEAHIFRNVYWDTAKKEITYTSFFRSVSSSTTRDTIVYNYGTNLLTYVDYFDYKGHGKIIRVHSP